MPDRRELLVLRGEEHSALAKFRFFGQCMVLIHAVFILMIDAINILVGVSSGRQQQPIGRPTMNGEVAVLFALIATLSYNIGYFEMWSRGIVVDFRMSEIILSLLVSRYLSIVIGTAVISLIIIINEPLEYTGTWATLAMTISRTFQILWHVTGILAGFFGYRTILPR
ncbi:hypothetical protein AAE478_004600 [Parahypoxylon ruwenzoriense]